MTAAEIIARLDAWPAVRHVVLTGGEPMIARDIHVLARLLRDAGFHITIETAATVPPDGIPCDLASLSPKLAHSTPQEGEADAAWRTRHESTRLKPQVIEQWLTQVPDYQLKFVVRDEPDLEEISTLLAGLNADIRGWRIQLMPEARTMEELHARSQWLSDACIARGWRYCQRLHILLYGNTRGT